MTVVTAHHAEIDPNSTITWGKFKPVLIASKPSAEGEKGWVVVDNGNPLLEGIPEDVSFTDADHSQWLQSNSSVSKNGWIDEPVGFADGAPLAVVRWDKPGILVSVGFNLENGNPVLKRVLANAVSLKRTKIEKATVKTLINSFSKQTARSPTRPSTAMVRKAE